MRAGHRARWYSEAASAPLSYDERIQSHRGYRVLTVASFTAVAAGCATSGQLLASRDQGGTWERRAELALRDLAVDPAAVDRLMVTTEQGLLRSEDGGRTYQAVGPGAPRAAVLLSWAAPDRLLAVDALGVVHRSSDGGVTWREIGTVGAAPEALVDTGRVAYVAVPGAVLESTDEGATWSSRLRTAG